MFVPRLIGPAHSFSYETTNFRSKKFLVLLDNWPMLYYKQLIQTRCFYGFNIAKMYLKWFELRPCHALVLKFLIPI